MKNGVDQQDGTSQCLIMNGWGLLLLPHQHIHYLASTTERQILLRGDRHVRTCIAWLQQMCLNLNIECKAVWTVSTWVRLCTSMNTSMLLQFIAPFKQLSTLAIKRSSVGSVQYREKSCRILLAQTIYAATSLVLKDTRTAVCEWCSWYE